MAQPVLDRQQSVGTLVLEHSACAQVFQRHHIDFCCRGHLSLEVAAAGRKLDVEVLLTELTQAIEARGGVQPADPRKLSTPELVAHIVATHHAPLREALPFIRGLAAKVSRVHGEHNPHLKTLEAAVEELATTLLPHLDEEEQTLFPALTASAPEKLAMAGQFAQMLDEHLAVGSLLERIRAAAEDFSLPDWACRSYQTLFAELEALEADVFTHVHLENHVLRPRFTTA